MRAATVEERDGLHLLTGLPTINRAGLGIWHGENLFSFLDYFSRVGRRRATFLRGEAVERTAIEDLFRRSTHVAKAIMDLRTGGRSHVVIEMGNSSSAVAAVLGAILSDSIAVLVPPGVTPEERRFIWLSCQPSVFLADARDTLSRAKELNTDGSTVLVDASAAESDDRETVLFSDIILDEGRAPHLRPERRGSDAAVVTFSAGSSGSPKGIVYSHDGLLAEAWQLNAALPWNYPKALSVAPISHAIGFLTTFVIPLIRCLDILVDQSWDPRRALAWCEREQYSPFCGLPSMVSAVLDSPDFNPEMIRSLPCVGLGGSAVPGELLHRLEALGAKPYQMYGSTELPSVTSTLSGGNLGTTESSPNLQRVVVGLPLPANQVEIRDEAGKICGPHIEGHVVCRGPELCVGYVDSADVAVDEEGWLWTGDLGYLDHHGRLVISGRISSQIQVAGEKVSAEAIEDLLALRIGEAAGRRWAVSASLAPLLGEVVTLAAVPGIRGELRLSELVRELRERGVAALHCPARIVEVDAIPATDVGKIDRQRLGSKVRAALGQIG